MLEAKKPNYVELEVQPDPVVVFDPSKGLDEGIRGAPDSIMRIHCYTSVPMGFFVGLSLELWVKDMQDVL